MNRRLEICELLVRSNAVDVIVIDSVAALIPRAEIEGEMGDSHMGLQARLMSQALRKLTGAIAKSKCTVIFINQIREKIGVMFGNPETTPGGRALKFYASVRIDVRRTQTIKEGETSIGARTRARVVKNTRLPPHSGMPNSTSCSIAGISYEGDLVDLAALGNVVEKSGAWYNYKTTRLGQGRENAKQFLQENKDLAEEIRQAVLQSKGPCGCQKIDRHRFQRRRTGRGDCLIKPALASFQCEPFARVAATAGGSPLRTAFLFPVTAV